VLVLYYPFFKRDVKSLVGGILRNDDISPFKSQGKLFPVE